MGTRTEVRKSTSLRARGLRFPRALLLALLLLAPIFAAVYLLKTLAGIDILAAGNLPTGVIAQKPPLVSSPM